MSDFECNNVLGLQICLPYTQAEYQQLVHSAESKSYH